MMLATAARSDARSQPNCFTTVDAVAEVLDRTDPPFRDSDGVLPEPVVPVGAMKDAILPRR